MPAWFFSSSSHLRASLFSLEVNSDNSNIPFSGHPILPLALDLSIMDPELVLGTIQTVVGIFALGIAAVQLFQQWPRRLINVWNACT
jgi:hypothetical protein